MRAFLFTVAAIFLGCGSPTVAADFYAGRQITILVGFTPGGTYDQIARFYARHLARFIPGKPTIVVQNMPGAGSLVATTHLANVAPRDGTVLGIVNGGVALEPILGNPQARYDSRNFGWIGSRSGDTFVCAISSTSAVATIEQAKTREIVAGSTGPGSRTLIYPIAMNELLGTKFKVVSGYPGGNEISMAVEKGEVESYCGWAVSSIRQRSMDWVKQGKIRLLAQFALTKNNDFPDVPLATDLAKTPTARSAFEFLSADAVNAWPMVAPPGLPVDRLELLRNALMAMLSDPEARDDGIKSGMEIDPVPGVELEALINRLYKTPPEVIALVKKIVEAR
mgnify:FL=1